MAFTVYAPKEVLDVYKKNAVRVAWALADASDGFDIEFKGMENFGEEDEKNGDCAGTF